MKLKPRKYFLTEVATSSLNDIMFFLLLFFLIISTVTNPKVMKVILPKSTASQTLNKQPITLTITEDKHYFINKREIQPAHLEQSLQSFCKGIPEPTVVLRMPGSHSIQDLVEVMQIGIRNKLKMVLATDKKR